MRAEETWKNEIGVDFGILKMVAAVSTALNPKTTTRGGPLQNPTRPPLLPSEPDNGIAPHRRPKAREVTSRYMSSSSSSSSSTSTSTSSSASNSRRCPSPLVSRTATMTPMPSVSTLAKRSQSVERRRMATPRPNSLDLRANGEVSAAQKLLFTSARSLSVSFQGESFSLQVSKTKSAPAPSGRKGTPERRKATTPVRAADHTENSRPVTDQQRWPGRLRQPNCMSRSLDFTDERKKVDGSAGSVVRALQNSTVDVSARLCSESEKAVELAVEGDSGIVASDTESVSSDSTSGAQDCGGGDGGAQGQRCGPRGIVVPARFWQETNNRLRRQLEPCSVSTAKTVGTKTMAPPPPKLIAPKKLSIDSPVSSPRGVANSRGQLSPVRGAARPASPSKLGPSSPLRGMSPSRMRNSVAGTPNSSWSNTPSILSFAVDVRRGRIGDNRMVDAHLLRILHNRFLQWRFVNARAGAALSAQRSNAEV
jgi:hypothetical protein